MKALTLLAAVLLASAAAAQQSPYISHVYDYQPAPGQFVGVNPTYTEGMSADDMLQAASDQLVSTTTAKPGMVSLGSYGGNIVFGFDHPVVNVAGAYDFKIYGNAMATSAEPGIVMVSRDDNGNGLPDDTWYELAGSDYNAATTLHGYAITYNRPAAPLSDPVSWTSNDTDEPSGTIARNMFHKQSYWPAWLPDDVTTLTFTGTRLAKNATNAGSQWQLHPCDWGYADNQTNDTDKGMNIEWAVNASGQSVHLSQIDFIKVYTAIVNDLTMIGETSTEVCGAEDLHPTAVAAIASIRTDADDAEVQYYNLQGQRVGSDALAPGIYIRRQGSRATKVVCE